MSPPASPRLRMGNLSTTPGDRTEATAAARNPSPPTLDVITSGESQFCSLPLLSPAQPSPTPDSPPPPSPSFWQCHRCGSHYRLSCTTRCLSCSHRFCGSRTPPSRSRHRPGTCRVLFDHHGWETRGLWRRGLSSTQHTPEPYPSRPRRPLTPEEDEGRRASLFEASAHSCVVHCDFPGQCRQVALMRRRARARDEEDSRLRSRSETLTEIAALGRIARQQQPGASPGDVSPLSPVREEEEDEMDESWFSGSSSDAEDDIIIEYIEGSALPGQAEDEKMVCALEGVMGNRGPAPRRLTVVTDERGSSIFLVPVSPDSPDLSPGSALAGTAAQGMDGDEWAEEFALMRNIELGQGEARTVAPSELVNPWTQPREEGYDHEDGLGT